MSRAFETGVPVLLDGSDVSEGDLPPTFVGRDGPHVWDGEHLS